MPIINEKANIEEAKEIQAKIRNTRSARAFRAYATGISEIMVRIMETAAIQVKIRKSVKCGKKVNDETYRIKHKSFRDRIWKLWFPSITQPMNKLIYKRCVKICTYCQGSEQVPSVSKHQPHIPKRTPSASEV